MKIYHYSLLFFFTLATLFFDVSAMPPTLPAIEGTWSKVTKNKDQTGTLEEIVVFKKEGDYKFKKLLNLSTEKKIKAKTAEGNYGVFHKKLELTLGNKIDKCKVLKFGSVWIQPKDDPDNMILILALMDDWKKKIFKVLGSENPDVSYETWDRYVIKTEIKKLDSEKEGDTLVFKSISSSPSMKEEYKKTDSVQIADIQGLKLEMGQTFWNELEPPNEMYED